jgi:hypothetical protein
VYRVLKPALALTLLLASTVHAQVLTAPAVFSPAAPRETDEIRARFDVAGLCRFESTTVVAGTAVRTTTVITDCIVGPPQPLNHLEAVFGPLPAGTYMYEIYLDYGGGPELRSTQPLVVAAVAPAVPALSPHMLIACAIALAVAGLVIVRRM